MSGRPFRFWEDLIPGKGEQRMITMTKEQMKNTERAYLKNKRIQAKLDQDLYGPKGILLTYEF